MTRPSNSNTSATCLVRLRQDPEGQFTAQVLGVSDLQATAATREEAVEQVRALLQEQVNLGSLLAIDLPRENPLMSRLGYAKDDPYFEEYLEEMRKFREEMDRRENPHSDPSECSGNSFARSESGAKTGRSLPSPCQTR